jgi:hypothetical protein
MSICAIDIDIREFTVVGNGMANQRDDLHYAVMDASHFDMVLIEVASAICYHGDSKAAAASTARWQIWNSLAAGVLWAKLARPDRRVRVSPSSRWTMGYDEKTRHAMAGINPVKFKKNGVPVYAENHDIRECRAMLWSYSVKPALWVPMEQYLESL